MSSQSKVEKLYKEYKEFTLMEKGWMPCSFNTFKEVYDFITKERLGLSKYEIEVKRK